MHTGAQQFGCSFSSGRRNVPNKDPFHKLSIHSNFQGLKAQRIQIRTLKGERNVFGERYVVLLGNGTLGQDCYFGGGEYSVRVLGVGLRYMFMGLNLKCPLLLSVR